MVICLPALVVPPGFRLHLCTSDTSHLREFDIPDKSSDNHPQTAEFWSPAATKLGHYVRASPHSCGGLLVRPGDLISSTSSTPHDTEERHVRMVPSRINRSEP